MTELLPATPENISRAAQTLQRGGLVAFPTETVYGLGCNALDEEAVKKIFTAKGRPSEDPLIIHLSSVEQLPRVCASVPEAAQTLAATFWPGPLTLILPKNEQVPYAVTAGLETVAVRVPNHPVAQSLLKACNLPIAAPSANRFGHTSPTLAEHVLQDLDGRIDIILDGGPASIGVESTVLDISTSPARILRPGGVPREALQALLGPIDVLDIRRKAEAGLPSPGLLEKHYAPRAELVFFLMEEAGEQMLAYLTQEKARGRMVGVLAAQEEAPAFEQAGAVVYHLGPSRDTAQIANRLYAGMRWLDKQGVDVIACRDFGTDGLGLAIRDRLRRAAIKVIN